MKSSEAVAAIAKQRGDAVIVSTMTAIRWLDKCDGEGLNIACVPLMGGASALGLGIALAQPGRKVLVLDGDGSLLMQLPALVTSIEASAENFVHVVFNNGVWFEGLANLPVPAEGKVNFSKLAEGAGYKRIFNVHRLEDLEEALQEIMSSCGPTFLELNIVPASDSLWSASNHQPDLQDFHFTRLGEEIRRVRRSILEAIE